MAEFSWDIFKIGSLAGLMSFCWLLIKDFLKLYRRPRLRVSFKRSVDLRTFTLADTGWVRKFCTLHVRNRGSDTARRCVATLKILEKPEGTEHLEEEYALHWAGVTYTMQTTGAEPVNIGAEPRRLDVVFTDRGQNLEGSWLAIPFALSGQLTQNQSYLPPGEYRVKLHVSCENGGGTSITLTVVSPTLWEGLDVTLG